MDMREIRLVFRTGYKFDYTSWYLILKYETTLHVNLYKSMSDTFLQSNFVNLLKSLQSS